jgi:diguanylate cyclase (GGDEF)-like protein
MDLYALDSEVNAIETMVSSLEGQPRLQVLVQLAWYLRQRDCQRTLALINEASTLLQQDHLKQNQLQQVTQDERILLDARINLIRSEIHWLHGELGIAEKDAQLALQSFNVMQDFAVIGDTCFLLSSIHRDLGEIDKRDQFLKAAIEQYHIARDTTRYQIALARKLHNGAINDPNQTAPLLEKHFSNAFTYPVAVVAWLDSARAIVANKIGELGESCRLHIQAHRAALDTGQIRQAILTATNAGDSFATLGDLDSALEWDETALAFARQQQWPSSLAIALLQTGNALRLLERYADAKEKLMESLSIQEKISGSRTFAHTLAYLGDLSIDLETPDEALRFFELAAERIQVHNEPVFISDCWRGQAIAYCRLGQPRLAHEKIQQALSIAREQKNLDEQIKCLRVYAELAKKHPELMATLSTANQLSLAYLLEALALCENLKAGNIPATLLDDIADNYAQIQDFESAFHYAKLAAKAKENRRLHEARNRATAMQVKHDNERHRADAEYHRQIAKTEAARAASLQESSNTLETLGLIGREITANLNVDAVFKALHRHVDELLDATSFGISLLSTDGLSLDFVFGIENGKPISNFATPIDHPISSFARCARERQEIVLEREPGATGRFIIPGTMETLSLLYTPLIVGERLLGVMSIQSIRPNVYGERERSILRTLAAYGAIALDNASAYKQLQATLNALRETQNQLEEVSITDPLTGLRNRRFLLQNIEGDVAKAIRAYEDQLDAEHESTSLNNDEDLVFFMVDLDHFKSVNDTYGHASGDMVLIQMRDRLQSVFRESDYLIRWGGEEFLVVARSCNRRDAGIVAERIRQTVSTCPFKLLDDVEISRTCSVGYASFPFLPQQPHLITWSQVINFADQGLYMVKKGGRNACIGITQAPHVQLELLPQSDDFYNRIMRHPQQAAQSGLIQIITHNVRDLNDAINAS